MSCIRDKPSPPLFCPSGRCHENCYNLGKLIWQPLCIFRASGRNCSRFRRQPRSRCGRARGIVASKESCHFFAAKRRAENRRVERSRLQSWCLRFSFFPRGGLSFFRVLKSCSAEIGSALRASPKASRLRRSAYDR